jgi:hypothetical protein
MLGLLRLAPELLRAVASLGAPLPSVIISERWLRQIINIPPAEQRRKIDTIIKKHSEKHQSKETLSTQPSA